MINAKDDDDKNIPVTVDQVLQVLEQGSITEEFGVMRWSSNYTFLLGVEHDDIHAMAVYKPRKGERPLWDFPDGTLCNREVAAFLTSYQLGWNLVPPTVLRDGPHGIGSFQFFIEHDPNMNYFVFEDHIKPQLRRLVLFDCIVNNADRKGGHCLLDENEHVWAIDHGITFNVEHKLRTVIWDYAGEPIENELVADLENLCAALDNPSTPYATRLAELINPREINAFRARLRRLLQQKRYPRPGAGPNYPWPPV